MKILNKHHDKVWIYFEIESPFSLDTVTVPIYETLNTLLGKKSTHEILQDDITLMFERHSDYIRVTVDMAEIVGFMNLNDEGCPESYTLIGKKFVKC